MQQGCPIEMSVLNNRMSSFGFGRRRSWVGGAPSESVADDEKRMELKGGKECASNVIECFRMIPDESNQRSSSL